MLGGRTIPDGQLYIGGELRATNGRHENCLIDPALPIAARADGPTGLHYWPSYAHLTPAGRRVFIDWLADGRSDPAVEIGFVFIFFYGLERRLFVDRTIDEADQIVAEVERLLRIYGNNNSFSGYATLFLQAARAIAATDLPLPTEPQETSFEVPFAVRLAIGRLLAAGRTIDAVAAFAWVLTSPETRLRTPGRRCFDELKRLWIVRFSERHPAGLAIRAPKRRLSLTYRAASGTFETTLTGPEEGLPDIGSLTAPLQGLRDLLQSCETELEAYSRLLGRRPEARESLEAALLLPAPIRDAGHPAIAAVLRKLEALFSDASVATISLGALAGLLGLDQQDGSAAQSAARLALVLDQLGIGMEPDRRYGGPSPGSRGLVALFRAAGGGAIEAGRTPFETARTVLEIGVLAALADGTITLEELHALVAQARTAQGLDPHERLRLEAFVQSLAAEPPRLQAALRRAAALPADGRAAIAHAAVGAVLADGDASGNEVRFLERLHRGLQLPVEAMHASLHQRTASRDGPIVVSGEDFSPDIPLPSEPAIARSGGVALDARRLARIREETSNVSALLAEVFAEPEPAEPGEVGRGPATKAPSNAGMASPYTGLDSAHGALLAAVVTQQGRLSIDAFDAEARSRGLLPGAATETINDWGFATHDEAVLEEEDDLIVIPDHLRPTLAPN